MEDQQFHAARFEAVVFDIGGTLLDSTGGIIAGFQQTLGGLLDSERITEIARECERRVEHRMEEMRLGREPFAAETEIRRDVVVELDRQHSLRLNAETMRDLVGVGGRYGVFPDTRKHLDEVSQHAPIIGLTNSGLDQIMRASARNGLRWSALLGSQLVETYKPDQRAYVLVPNTLRVDPAAALFVAAHPWDLRGAAEAGFRTVYIPRPHADGPEPDDQFDFRIDALDELVPILTGE